MTVEEMDNMFDVLYNNITSNQAPGLNAYEKSVFLTKAQDEVVKNYFSPKSKGNNLQEGFDDSPKRQIDFSRIMETMTTKLFGTPLFDTRENTKSITFRKAIMMMVNESVEVTRNEKTIPLQVVPIKYDEYSRLMSKPYKRPLKYQAWRLITNLAEYGENKMSTLYNYLDSEGLLKSSFTYSNFKSHFTNGITSDSEVTVTPTTMYTIVGGRKQEVTVYTIKIDDYYLSNSEDLGTDTVIKFTATQRDEVLNIIKTDSTLYSAAELIVGPSDTITKYTARYIRRPNPIIVSDLDGLSIEGEDATSECELDASIHEEIVQRAVELAKIAWTATGQDNVQLVMQAGQRSE